MWLYAKLPKRERNDTKKKLPPACSTTSPRRFSSPTPAGSTSPAPLASFRHFIRIGYYK